MPTATPTIEEETVRRNIPVKQSLWDRLLKAKAREGRLLSKIIEVALEEYLAKHHPAIA